MRFKQVVIEYSFRHGVAKAAIRYKTTRQNIYRRRKKYDGNGKVEISHRKDNEAFYTFHKFYCFEDFETQLAVRPQQYNNFPTKLLNWRSPNLILFSYPNV